MRMLLPALLLIAGCTPPAGTFCSEADSSTCWDVDIGGKTMAAVWPNGRRSPPWTMESGDGDHDYSIKSPINGSRVELKVIDRNTLGIRNSETAGGAFKRFVRQ